MPKLEGGGGKFRKRDVNPFLNYVIYIIAEICDKSFKIKVYFLEFINNKQTWKRV